MRKWISSYGEEVAIEMLVEHMEKRSIASIASNTGRIVSKETRQKLSIASTGVSNALKGKTFEEFYGATRAQQLSSNHSNALKQGYADGRLKPTARSKSAPEFRGVKLRSKLEQSAIEFLEKRDGLVFGETLLYEDKTTRVQWLDEFGVQHTYQPDLKDLVNNITYEVKPAWKVDKPTFEMLSKQRAVIASGEIFRYLTDKEIRCSIIPKAV